MPTYEYECVKTGRRFDLCQSMKDDPIQNCPECGGDVRRIISTGAGLIFKGSGFYATDYRNNRTSGPACGRSSTCCGRDTPCERRTCDE